MGSSSRTVFAHLGADYENISVGTVAVGLTANKYSGKYKAIIQVESHPIRILYTGADPTASSGLYYNSGSEIEISGNPNLVNFKAISANGSTATLRVLYEV